MRTVGIITPWMGGLDLLVDYAAAIQGAHEVVTVDNGSDEATARALEAAGGTYLRNDTNAGFAAANNQGYAASTADIIVFLNSDVAGDARFVRAVLADVKDGALYGPSLQQQLVYGMWLPYIEGWCVATTRATWDRIKPHLFNWTLAKQQGAWDELQRQLAERTEKGPLLQPGPWDAENYPGPYWEDNDLCLRALQAGISLVQTQWPITHKGGRTAGAIIKHGETFERNRATFAARARQVWEETTK